MIGVWLKYDFKSLFKTIRCGFSPRIIRGPPLEYSGAWSFLEIKSFIGKMGEINKWPQDMVEINILPTQEVEINII